MKKIVFGTITKKVNDNGRLIVRDASTKKDITKLFRTSIIDIAFNNGQALKFDKNTGRASRINPTDIIVENIVDTAAIDADPVIQLIKTSNDIKPSELEISDIKWKYLIRSVARGKNIMMVGPAGCGKTQAAKCLPDAIKRPFFYFNLGSTQDPRATLIGNTHFKNNETMFNESAFVKAIQTENSIILLDELSRAHPEAWNILMTVLDEGQRYLRLDEDLDAPVIKVAKGVSFIATANIGTEYTSTRVLDRALMDRFEIIEVDILSLEQETTLLSKRFGKKIEAKFIEAVADIADCTRKEWRSEEGKLSTMVSTRMTVRVCELLADGFTLQEAAEVAIIPFFDASGGADSERVFVKQIIQKHMDSKEQDIFNAESVEEDQCIV
jgi:nitric oxide reductase NorQ protein|tara:strand:+ start:80 stop:1228 length:1149 start_codon:yes stop_codon:yes gene_type:complete